MKRKVLCIFSLIAYLLLFCTCVSPAIQREMTILTDVKIIKRNTKVNGYVPAYAGTWGGEQRLYQIVEGSGWNTGNRVAEIPKKYYQDNGVRIDDTVLIPSTRIILHPGTPYTVIISASRTPQEGDLVEIAQDKTRSGEKLILYFPEGYTPITQLSNNFTILQEGEHGMLLDTRNLITPFFEHRTMESFKDLLQAEGMRIYSYSDALSFLWQMPLLALAGGLLLAGGVLWGGACRMTNNTRRIGPVVGISALAISAILLLIFGITWGIDLPASLIPSENIFQISHYVSEFSNMFTAVDDIGLTVSLIASALLSVAILIAGIAGGILLVRQEQKLLEKWHALP